MAVSPLLRLLIASRKSTTCGGATSVFHPASPFRQEHKRMLTRQNSVLRLTTQITTMGLICLFVDCQLAKADEPENLNDPGKPSARVTTNSVLEQQPLVPELNWSEADSKSKWQIVALLADHMRSNFDKIRTWRGKYHVRSIEPQRESFLRSAFAGRVDGRDLSDVTLERDSRT